LAAREHAHAARRPRVADTAYLGAALLGVPGVGITAGFVFTTHQLGLNGRDPVG